MVNSASLANEGVRCRYIEWQLTGLTLGNDINTMSNFKKIGCIENHAMLLSYVNNNSVIIDLTFK